MHRLIIQLCACVFTLVNQVFTSYPNYPEPLYGYRDSASMQLEMYANRTKYPTLYRKADGIPVDDIFNTRKAGRDGPVILDDMTLLESLTHFNREKIPERVVHAKGTGAFGYFEGACDMSEYTQASLFRPKKKTPLFARLSTALGSNGAAETNRELRGIAVKFYTPEGNWDLLTINMPVFFVRDPMRFASFVHTRKVNPATGIRDKTMNWDFVSSAPESLASTIYLYSSSALPRTYANLQTHAVNPFGFTKPNMEHTLVKFHIIPTEGQSTLTPEEASMWAGKDQSYLSRDLFNRIAKGNYPTWNLTAEMMTRANIDKLGWDKAFDVTKLWPEHLVKIVTLGTILLNRNPSNFFAEVEQSAFSPSRVIPGIEVSLDPMLGARVFSYPDTQNHRLGINHQLLPVNRPIARVSNVDRDGVGRSDDNQDGAPNYVPNSFKGPEGNVLYKRVPYPVNGMVQSYNSSDYDNYSLPGKLWDILVESERDHIATNIAKDLVLVPKFIKEKAITEFNKASPDWGSRVTSEIAKLIG